MKSCKKDLHQARLFPFGQQVQKVVQQDRSPKDVFVLGVYASAVHACWVNCFGKTLVQALAVASEPHIFWTGVDAERIIESIIIPPELGSLTPPRQAFNGPSGIALDDLILNPLGLERKKTWLCDLVPYSCANSTQRKAIDRAYLPVMEKYHLPEPSTPLLPNPLTNESRRKEILDELISSKAKIIILLGDLPIRWFLHFFDQRWKRLSDFDSYGQLHDVQICNQVYRVLPLAHPRQIAKLGHASAFWYDTHSLWLRQSIPNANILN